MRIIILLLALCGNLMAEDWTIGAKTYQNVVVGQVEADCVHITYEMGIGSIKLADMPPDLQKRFGYDPSAAKQAEAAKSKALYAAIAALPSPPKSVIDTETSSDPAQKPQADKSAILAQIQFLKDDINQKMAITAKEKKENPRYSGNGYADVIAAEQLQIAQLQAQLH